MTVKELVEAETERLVDALPDGEECDAYNCWQPCYCHALSSLGIWDAEVLEAVVQPAISSEGAGGMICIKTHAENAGHTCRVIVLKEESE